MFKLTNSLTIAACQFLHHLRQLHNNPNRLINLPQSPLPIFLIYPSLINPSLHITITHHQPLIHLSLVSYHSLPLYRKLLQLLSVMLEG